MLRRSLFLTSTNLLSKCFTCQKRIGHNNESQSCIFDALSKSSTGVSFNDVLLVSPTVSIESLAQPISAKCIKLERSDRDLYQFVQRCTPEDPLQDFRMTRVTFGSLPCHVQLIYQSNKTPLTLLQSYPLAANVVDKSFYVDNCLTCADTPEEESKFTKLFE